MTVVILAGDAREQLKAMPDKSVHCVVTSPPYYALRDYGVEGQIGLEATPAEFVAALVDVFREVRRVLRDDGTLWLNIGDSYAGSWGAQSRGNTTGEAKSTLTGTSPLQARSIGAHPLNRTGVGSVKNTPGLKPKDLMGIPWLVAFALRDDGWYLRQDIIWAKPNPMPESVRDRCTKSHEYVFLFAKSPRYYYDADAVTEGLAAASVARLQQDVDAQAGSFRVPGKTNGPMKAVSRRRGVPPRHAQYRESSDQSGLDAVARGAGRNKRSVWNVATQPFKGAHFATFPPQLVEPCVLAGSSPKVCSDCEAPWERVIERELRPTKKAARTFIVDARDLGADQNDQGSNRQRDGHQPGWAYETETLGFRPTCSCYDVLYRRLNQPRRARKRAQRNAWKGRWERLRLRPGLPSWPSKPCVILDPFGGAGTAGLVAERLGRDAILIELNPEYAALARDRLRTALCDVDAPGLPEVEPEYGPLFADVSA